MIETKPAIKSVELWLVFATIFSNMFALLLEDPVFVEYAEAYVPVLNIASVFLIGMVRMAKTRTAISGIFTTPIIIEPVDRTLTIHNETASQKWEKELHQADDEYIGRF